MPNQLGQCQQENAIGKLEATTESIGKTLERLGTVLEKIASQGTQIEKHEKDIDEVFGRMRVLELNQVEEKVKVGLIGSGISVLVSGITAFVVEHLKR